MDNPAAESSNELDPQQAADAFSSLLAGEPIDKKMDESPEAAAERLAAEELASKNQETPPAQDAQADQAGAEKIPVEVDGKTIELTKAEIAEHIKNGMRQADYTRKTMELADTRKAAEAETIKAQQERAAYAERLNVFAIQLHGAIEQQSKIDWQKLLETDPIEYMRQERIFNERQAAFAKAKSELAQFQEMQQAEQQKHLGEFLSNQQQQLVAKLPEWKDAAKRTAESAAIKQYLAQEGFTPEEIGSFVDHRQVVLSRKAMLYDNLMERASKATQRVATVPTKVERPGNGDNGSSERNAEAMKRLTKSGRIEDAAAVFAGIL